MSVSSRIHEMRKHRSGSASDCLSYCCALMVLTIIAGITMLVLVSKGG